MSHFTVMVKIPHAGLEIDEESGNDLSETMRAELAEMLGPYDEELTVDEYETECYCSANPQFGMSSSDCEECNGTGKHMTTWNPEGQWDWWSLGGRWLGSLRLKKGASGWTGVSGAFGNAPGRCDGVDAARFQDIDWDALRDKDGGCFSTYAVLDENGWHQPSKMGFVAGDNSREEFYESFKSTFIEGTDPTTVIAIVDCHS